MPSSWDRYLTPQNPLTPRSRGPKPERSTLTTVSDVLGTPLGVLSGGIGGMISGRPLDRMWENLTWKRRDSFGNVLGEAGMPAGWGRTLTGLGLDLALDPVNWIGGPVLKAGVKGLGAAGRLGAKGVRKLPLGPELAQEGRNIKDYFGRALVPFYGLPEDYAQTRRMVDADLRTLPGRVADDVWNLVKDVDKPTRQAALLAMEKGPGAVPRANQLAKDFAPMMSDIFDREARLALQDPANKIGWYAPHVFEPHMRKKSLLHYVGKQLSAKNPFAKRRTLTIDEALKAGAEPDVALAGFTRLLRGEKAVRSGQFIKNTLERFGSTVAAPGMEKINAMSKLADTPFWQQVVKIGGKDVKLADLHLPKEIAQDLNKYFLAAPKVLEGAPAIMQKGWEGANKVWRMGATVMRPGFHATNLQGNVFNMFLGGMGPTDIPKWMAKARQFNKNPFHIGVYSPTNIKDAIRNYNISGFGSTFAGSMTEEGLDQLQRLGRTRSKWNLPGKYTDAMARLGGKIEGNSKQAYFLWRLKKGDTLEAAARKTKDVLFDYGELTNVERRLRNIFPFYTWSRKNIPYQAKKIIEQPARWNVPGKFRRAMENESEMKGIKVPEAHRPGYMQEDAVIQMPWGKKGEAVYWNQYLPNKDINMIPIPGIGSRDVLMDVMNQVNPFFKGPLEAMTNKSFLTRREMYDPDLGYFGDYKPANAFEYLVGMLTNQSKRVRTPGAGMQRQIPVGTKHFLQTINPFFSNIGKLSDFGVDIAQGTTNPTDAYAIPSLLGTRITKRSVKQVRKDRGFAQAAAKRKLGKQRRQRGIDTGLIDRILSQLED